MDANSVGAWGKLAVAEVVDWIALAHFAIYDVVICCAGAAPARCNSRMSSANVPVSHLANVEALVQRAAEEAATRCGGGAVQMEQNVVEQRQSTVPRGAPPSYAASTAAVVCT